MKSAQSMMTESKQFKKSNEFELFQPCKLTLSTLNHPFSVFQVILYFQSNVSISKLYFKHISHNRYSHCFKAKFTYSNESDWMLQNLDCKDFHFVILHVQYILHQESIH